MLYIYIISPQYSLQKKIKNQHTEMKMDKSVNFKEKISDLTIIRFNSQITIEMYSILNISLGKDYSYTLQQLILFMNIFKTRMPICYDCSSTQNLKISSQYTAICESCFNRELAEIQYFKKYRQLDPQIDQITEAIYLGNEDAAISKDVLEEYGITAICACGNHLETPFINDPKYTYKLFEIGDASKQIIVHLFEEHYQWMKQRLKEGRKVLIHCSVGVSRSASFTIAYLMRQNWLTFEQALEFVRSKRIFVCPNNGFVAQLRAYEAQLMELRNKVE